MNWHLDYSRGPRSVFVGFLWEKKCRTASWTSPLFSQFPTVFSLPRVKVGLSHWFSSSVAPGGSGGLRRTSFCSLHQLVQMLLTQIVFLKTLWSQDDIADIPSMCSGAQWTSASWSLWKDLRSRATYHLVSYYQPFLWLMILCEVSKTEDEVIKWRTWCRCSTLLVEKFRMQNLKPLM